MWNLERGKPMKFGDLFKVTPLLTEAIRAAKASK